MTDIDDAYLAERERIAGAATKGYPEPKAGMAGPWHGWHWRVLDRAYQVYGCDLEHIATVADRDEARAIVDAVNHQQALIDEIRRLRLLVLEAFDAATSAASTRLDDDPDAAHQAVRAARATIEGLLR